MSNYDKEYKTENFFGNPYPELIEFFKTYKTKAKLLDLGCGQGRDAIPLARLGFCVTAIDLSEVGIKQIREAVDREGLNIISKIEDINGSLRVCVSIGIDFHVLITHKSFHDMELNIGKEVWITFKANSVKVF